jgi:hypothetical protein
MLKSLTFLLVSLMTLAGVLCSKPVWARPEGPPPEAIQACRDQAQDEGCSFQGRGGRELSGTCRQIKDGQIACVPKGHHRRHPPKGINSDPGPETSHEFGD